MSRRIYFKEGVHSFSGILKFKLISGSITIFGASVAPEFSSTIFAPIYQLPIPVFSAGPFCIEFFEVTPNEVRSIDLSHHQTAPNNFCELFSLVYYSPGNFGPVYPKPLFRKIKEVLNSTKPIRIFLFGEKGVGKSTLAHFLVNSLKSSVKPSNSSDTFFDYLTSSNMNSESLFNEADTFFSYEDDIDTKSQSQINSFVDRKICFIDLDPGQPSISQPTTISYTGNCPFIFNSSEHNYHISDHKYSVHTSNLSSTIPSFLQGVSKISKQVDCITGVHYSIVNSHGWIQKDGLGLQKKMIKHLHPDLLICLYKSSAGQPDIIHPNQLNLEIKITKRTQLKNPRSLRYVRYSTYLLSNTSKGFASIQPFCFPIQQFNYVFPIPSFSHFLRNIPRILNGSLVNLCHDDTEYNSPPKNSECLFKISPVKCMECYGMGIIRSIDISQKCIYIATPETIEVFANVNTLIYVPKEISLSLFRDIPRFHLTFAK